MEEVKTLFKIDEFSYCLFAHLYKYYEEVYWKDIPNIPKMNYQIPESEYFIKLFGKAQIEVNRMLRPYFQRIFSITYEKACDYRGLERYLTPLVIRSIRTQNRTLEEMDSPTLVLAICAVVLELNFFTITHNCYVNANRGHQVLTNILKRVDQDKKFFISEDSNVKPFKRMRRCCSGIMREVRRRRGLVIAVFKDIGETFVSSEFESVPRRFGPIGHMSPVSERTDSSVQISEEGSSMEPVLSSPAGMKKPVGATASLDDAIMLSEGTSEGLKDWVDPLPIEESTFDVVDDQEPYDFDRRSECAGEVGEFEIQDGEIESCSSEETEQSAAERPKIKCKKCGDYNCIDFLERFAKRFALAHPVSPETDCFSGCCPMLA